MLGRLKVGNICCLLFWHEAEQEQSLTCQGHKCHSPATHAHAWRRKLGSMVEKEKSAGMLQKSACLKDAVNSSWIGEEERVGRSGLGLVLKAPSHLPGQAVKLSPVPHEESASCSAFLKLPVMRAKAKLMPVHPPR